MKTRNLLCALLMAAAFPFHAGAGTLFYVPIPATGSDAQSGMDPAKVYTSAIAAGNTKAAGRTVNGLALGALTGAGNTCTANGVTLSAATGTLNNGGGKAASIQADGAMADLLAGMIFNDGAGDNSEQYAVLDPVTLTVGKTYDLRVYVCNASGENRQVSLSFAGDGKPAVSTDFFNEDDATTSAGGFAEPNQVYYINYRFTWDGVSTPGFTATQKFGGTPFCLYAVTNQETGDADARPVGAMLAAEPERAPISRSTRTSVVDTTEDIGVSSEVFYGSQSLRKHGRWVTVGSYGRCWQPTGVDEDWQPYTRGRWVYSNDDGWVWDSDEDFGWATYHYGRWFREEDSGWHWVPGRVWAPAWVSWRHGHSYIGWAALPPVALAAAGVGISSWADHRWGIGPRAYNFVNARDFGAPSMAKVLIPRQQNPGIMTNTNNVTNIVNGRGGIYSGGPNFQAVNNALVRSGSEPIPNVRIERRTGTKPLTPDGKFSQLTAGVLALAAPMVTRNKKPGSLPPIAATIAAPKFDQGWNGLPDPKHAAALQAKIASETPGLTAKNAPAMLPGTLPPIPGTTGTKTAGTLKPFRPAKPTDTAFVKPGQPAPPTGVPQPKPGQPVSTAVVTPPQSGKPEKPTGVPFIKPGQPATPTAATPPQPGQPATPTVTGVSKRGKTPKPGTVAPLQPGPPASPTVVTPPQPEPRVKPTTPPPTPPVPAIVKPNVPAPPTPEPVRPRKRTPQPATPVPAPAIKPSTPATPGTEPTIPKRRTPPPEAPAPVRVKPATPPPAVPRPAPIAQPTPRPAPPVAAPARPAPVVPAPVAKPIPRPAPPVVAPVRPPPTAPVPAKPAAPVAPPTKGGKPTPTPTPGTKG